MTVFVTFSPTSPFANFSANISTFPPDKSPTSANRAPVVGRRTGGRLWSDLRGPCTSRFR